MEKKIHTIGIDPVEIEDRPYHPSDKIVNILILLMIIVGLTAIIFI